MASDKASFASGADQDGDLRRRNVPSQDTNGSLTNSNIEVDDKKSQKVAQRPLLVDTAALTI